VGARNMQNFSLLRELGGTDRPVILKRGLGASTEEFLLAAEYVVSHGNGRVVVCESGIRTFDVSGRPRFEINAIPLLKAASHLPVIADPSQSALDFRLVPPVALAAVAAGADGVLVEVGGGTTGPDRASATIGLQAFAGLVADLQTVAVAAGRGS
jgi:3-deoxy-7-phosphoheptulonate synthase